MHPFFKTIALLVAVFSPLAFAETQYSPAHSVCVSKAGTDSDLGICDDDELGKQDARLNTAYKRAMSALPAENKRKLQDAQVLWIKFRDADCALHYSLTGGTMDIVNGSGCTLSMTRDRADSLEWFANNGAENGPEEGEMDAW